MNTTETMTDYICVYFGGDQTGITWSITAKGFSSLKEAEKHGLYMMPMAGCFGFVVIQEIGDSWIICDEWSMIPPNVSVGVDGMGNYSVNETPKLVMV